MGEELLAEQVRALETGRAFVEHADVALVLVSGPDARAWLHDLVTTDVAMLERGRSRPSLLLSPTGRIRASFQVLGLGERRLVLAQRDDEPDSIADLLAPYVLSSDVTVEVASDLRLFSLPGAGTAPTWAGEGWRPSIHGPGADLLIGGAAPEREAARRRLEEDGLTVVGPRALEAWRVGRGVPRFPVDLDRDSLPAEAGLDDGTVVDRTKGCFLGQEAVAKVRNLGHPARVVLAATAEASVSPGEEVLAAGRPAGVVTSAYGSSAIVRIRWDAREGPLATAAGTRLRPR
jgi:folate-binding protein YgfZ